MMANNYLRVSPTSTARLSASIYSCGSNIFANNLTGNAMGNVRMVYSLTPLSPLPMDGNRWWRWGWGCFHFHNSWTRCRLSVHCTDALATCPLVKVDCEGPSTTSPQPPSPARCSLPVPTPAAALCLNGHNKLMNTPIKWTDSCSRLSLSTLVTTNNRIIARCLLQQTASMMTTSIRFDEQANSDNQQKHWYAV